MWPSNLQNLNNLTQKQVKIEHQKNNIQETVPVYQTPIKQTLNIPRNNETPVQFDFNFYFGNLWSSGHIPGHNVEIPMNMNNSVKQNNRENNMLLFKSSMEKSGYKLTPMSEIKNSNNSNIIECGLSNNINNINSMNNIYENDLNQNEFTKKNLTELFNNAKNDEFLQSTKKRINLDNNINYYNNGNNYNLNNTYQINLEYINEDNNNKENKNPNFNPYNPNNPKNTSNISIKSSLSNLSNNNINNEEMFNSPLNKKPKKIFECSGSTVATNSSKSSSRKRRFRKNNEQLLMLSQFFSEHKHWSKNQIKEISQKTGLKENKVYKWLWDQRNKEFKNTKFIINKKNPP